MLHGERHGKVAHPRSRQFKQPFDALPFSSYNGKKSNSSNWQSKNLCLKNLYVKGSIYVMIESQNQHRL